MGTAGYSDGMDKPIASLRVYAQAEEKKKLTCPACSSSAVDVARMT